MTLMQGRLRSAVAPIVGVLLWPICLFAEPDKTEGVSIYTQNMRECPLDQVEKAYAEMPPVRYTPPADRWKTLPRTAALLRKDGAELHVVMLGDSIVNDTNHSQWDRLLQRRYPRCKITRVAVVRGSTGCWWYKEADRVKKHVLPYHPDLLIIGGISQQGDTDSIREVVRQVRAAQPCDVLVMGEAFGRMDPRDDKQWQLAIDPQGKDYRARLMRLAQQEGYAFLDITAIWGQYIRDSGKPLEWFKRDEVHANLRGMQILGRPLVAYLAPDARSTGGKPGWKPDEAGKYLDERQKVWFGYANCISCHTGLPYALARPALRKLVGTKPPSEQETKLLAQIGRRVFNWKKLDTQEFGLYYDASDELKKQSWGTEAVFNAVILAFDDHYQSKSSPSEATKQAFAHLWQTQVKTGDHKGAWEWLDFNEPPWGNKEARYVGAALAAIAVGTAPGYYTPGADADTEARVQLLRRYLNDQLHKQNLHNRAWGLWASTQIEGILTKAEQKELSDQLLAKQQADGGWSLLALGPWVRSAGTARQTTSDGYATALVLHVLQTAGMPRDHTKVAKGLDWLKRHQAATGAWLSVSLIKKRDPASHAGKFMSDAATAFAVLALGH